MQKSHSPNQKKNLHKNNINTDFVDIKNARYEDQREIMEHIATAGHCPFCSENLKKYHKQPIIFNGQYWIATKNQWPYKYTRVHILLILKEHIESVSELSPEAGAEMIDIAAKLAKQYNVAGGGLAMRFGDTRFSAGTVRHLHAQFIVPDVDAPNFEPVRIKIGTH